LDAQEALIAAYREGLGLAAVAVVAGQGGTRLMTCASGAEAAPDESETVHARWWCNSTEQAEWLVKALARTARRDDADQLCRAVVAMAKRLGIALRSDDGIAREAAAVIARLEQEITTQQRAGALKSVNRGYRDYRLAASARGEKVLRYTDWMARYKAKLVREVAQNLRAL
jgi:hypothetical protein